MRKTLFSGVLLGFLAACGSAGVPERVDPGVALPLPTREATGSEVELLGEIDGLVDFEEDTGCVVVVVGDRRYPAIWPSGTSATRDPFRIVLPGGEVVRKGDAVAGSGGYPSADAGWDPAALGVPPACLDGPGRTPGKEAAAFNPSGEIVVRPGAS